MAPSNSSSEDNGVHAVTITPKELKELRRVYDKLCYFSEKVTINEKLKPVEDRLNQLERPEIFHETKTTDRHNNALEKNHDDDGGSSTNVTATTTAAAAATTTTPEPIKREIKSLNALRKTLRKELQAIDNRSEQTIRPRDVAAAMKSLGKTVSKRRARDVVWEVDEKLDGVVDWDEFKLMFERNIRDTTGLEPASFYNMVQFMIYDRDDNGMVSIDETMNMLYARLGREKMESTIGKLFGGEDGQPIKEVGAQGGEIDFSRYWEVVEKEQKKLFSDSELGKTLAEKKKRKVDPNRGKKI
mmetsp:Transcript_50791/g.61211  ORF Transcript_50791/g.61211 Transcript_50791/m.61211 type:complete len:300 (-) Transcript_50791:187-1086(-)